MKTTHFLTATITYTAMLLALTACGSGEEGKQKAAGNAPPPTEVDVVTVTTGSVVLTQDLPGRLEAYRTAQVRAQVEGIIEKRLFTEGSDVKAGARLFQIDARKYRTAYESAKSDLLVARQTMERYKQLLEVKAISRQNYDQVEAKFKQAEAAMSKAQIDFDNTHVPAPISGRIGRALVTEGALVGHGEATLLATIEQIDPIYANFIQSGSDVLRLQQAFQSGTLKRAESKKVELILEDGSVYAKPGKLLFSNLAVDSSTGSVSLRAEFPNPEHKLLPGMFVRIRFREGISDNSIKVPQRAVEMTTSGQIVMVVDQGKVTPRPIKTGAMAGGDFVVEEGLQAGDRVIVNGLQKIRPGAPVKAVEWNPEGNVPAANEPVPVEEK